MTPRPPTPEKKSERQMLIEKLKANLGRELNQETTAMLVAWQKEQERLADTDPTVQGRIMYCLDLARLYSEAGYLEAAKEQYENALLQADQEDMADLAYEIEREIEREL